MKQISRRHFLRAAGLTVIVLGCQPVLSRIVPAEANAGSTQDPAIRQAVPTRWAMVIDARKCAARGDCTVCIDACHRAHNVPQIGGEKEEIKWIWKAPSAEVFRDQTSDVNRRLLTGLSVPVLCNHCDNPPCVRACPTQATFRRPDGIVAMDMHRCIGCRYCMAACPYGARSFNWRDPRPHIGEIDTQYPTRTKGVVEKCTFCVERIDKGLRPICVEACPAGALVFGNLLDANSTVSGLLEKNLALLRRPELGTRPQDHYIDLDKGAAR